jgi:hypothetical protein
LRKARGKGEKKMEIIFAELPSRIAIAYDGETILINRKTFKEVATCDGGTIGEIFAEVCRTGRLCPRDNKKLSLQLVDISKMVER